MEPASLRVQLDWRCISLTNQRMTRTLARTASGGFSRIWRASASAVGISSACGTTRLIRPCASPSSAVNMRPVSAISFANRLPVQNHVTTQCWAPPRPRCTSRIWNCVPGAATTRSHDMRQHVAEAERVPVHGGDHRLPVDGVEEPDLPRAPSRGPAQPSHLLGRAELALAHVGARAERAAGARRGWRRRGRRRRRTRTARR